MRNNRNSKKENKINESYIDNSNEIEEQQYEEENESLFSKLINPEKPELTPEEEILNYQEEDTLKKRKKIQNEEEEEKLRKVKEELLSSLKRVDEIVKRFYPTPFQKVVKAKNKLKTNPVKEQSIEIEKQKQDNEKKFDENERTE